MAPERLTGCPTRIEPARNSSANTNLAIISKATAIKSKAASLQPTSGSCHRRTARTRAATYTTKAIAIIPAVIEGERRVNLPDSLLVSAPAVDSVIDHPFFHNVRPSGATGIVESTKQETHD